MKTKSFYDNIFHRRVYAVWGTRAELNKWTMKKFKMDIGQDDNYNGFHIDITGGKGSIVWLENKKDFYTLMHESVHLVRTIFEQLGITTDLSVEDEMFAYYQIYWFKTLWRWFGNLKQTT